MLLEVLVFVQLYYSTEAFWSSNKHHNISSSQVFLGHSGVHDIEGNELPRLVYVSREKRPGYQHHKKAGAENALVCSDATY